MGGVAIALLSLKNTVALTKKKQSSDLVFAGRKDRDFLLGIDVLRRRHAAGSVRELAFPRNHADADALSISYLLNYFEALSIGVSQGIYDEAILLSNYRGTLVGIWSSSSDYVRELRKVKSNADICVNVQCMAERWAKPGRRRT